MAYLCGKTPVKGIRITQRVIAIVIVLIGSVASLGIVWDTADVLMGLMAVINYQCLPDCQAGAPADLERLPGTETGWEESGL